jgi:hypothetical protein
VVQFHLLPSLSLILLAPLALAGRISPLQDHIILLSAVTLLTFMGLRFGTIFYSLRRDGHKLREIWLAYLTHIGLGWIFSASWIKCLFDHRSPFVRTNKFLGAVMPGPLRATLVELSLGVCLLAACAVLAFTDFIFGPIAAMTMGVARFLVYWVWQQTQYTRRLSTDRLTGLTGESSAGGEVKSGADLALDGVGWDAQEI